MNACQDNTINTFPVLHIEESENRRFIFTNKNSGFFSGNSHQINRLMWEGWYIDNTLFLLDYDISIGAQHLSRDSIDQFTYYPHSSIRKYVSGLQEKFTLLDSINAIVWELESKNTLTDLQFKPILNTLLYSGSDVLSKTIPRLILPLRIKEKNASLFSESWLGLNFSIENENRIVVIAVIESSEEETIKRLDRLALEYPAYIQARIDRISHILQKNQTYTNLPEITEALNWSQLSLSALIHTKDQTGIQSGLPASTEYLGRDAFISMTGALLVNGQFQLAKKMLTYFGNHQLKNKKDHWYGRIPHQIHTTQVDYSTADVTWWYIRAIYEYLLFSGDEGFLKAIYPVVKRAIDGAILFRIDEHFYLTHRENETWMSQSGKQILSSQRGNRAVEIQSLWYTALMIGSKMASWNNEPKLEEYWLTIAQSLRKNFQRDFWRPFRNRMYDHLTIDGSPNRSIRPNILFTASLPHLPGIPPFITDKMKAQVTHTVLNKLTFRYGTSTLWQADPKFISRLNMPLENDYKKSFHNGIIWHWLSGPLITNLLFLNLDEIAFYLYLYESNQILYEDGIGSLASFRDVHPMPQNEPAFLRKNLSSSMSLAEFTRNFYQDFVGYRPDAISQQILFTPVFPTDIKFVSTILPYAQGRIHFKFSDENNLFKYEISIEGLRDEVDIEFRYPGFDTKKIVLNEEEPSIRFNLDPTLRRSYSRYNELDWHFAHWEQ